MSEAVLGLGTNIGDREKNLREAIAAIGRLPGTELLAVSTVYETAPWGYTEQADFYNICARIETGLSPHSLLGACLGIEAAMGRERPFKNSPRIIDIDVLMYENYSAYEEELTVPHKEIANRAFVLYPLKEVLDGKKITYNTDEALKNVSDQQVKNTGISIY